MPKTKPRSTPLPLSDLPDCALVRERQLLPVLPFAPVTLWRKVKAGAFPSPHRLENGRITAWRWGDVRQWLEAQTRQEAA
ncbi:AlpA family phage regulatory protein [Luteimonas sp. M1R5S18]|uniref:AlpA family phage regulatory protein n=1 Tax=Luteimonas rhizosphaericola TaxID=3042024 RepID=A0ABT6JGK1_9GAMM|nr:AlpA family phage regulatory protein [Luteimonas rhizosphaericola]MDH5829789.1 AlpA family phage regulatory protein [Luteimonas rhizosphaericola]